jgi:hypothetical protein
LEKAITASAHAPSYEVGSKLLRVIGEIDIAGRQLNKLAVRIGGELTASRDAQTDAYFDQPLPRQATAPKTPIALASVSCDGGRAQTRRDGGPAGVHDPHWRETKNALFLRAISQSFDDDPHPHLPTCFADRRQMKDLLAGLGEAAASLIEANNEATQATNRADDWRPEVLFRTCLSSLGDSDSFGRMMAAEADSRGFYGAAKQSFVADGLPYNWTIQQRHFPTFTPIVDFVHVVEHLYDAARSVSLDEAATWQTHIAWAEACWQGRVSEVLAELRVHQTRIGLPPPDCEASDARQVVSSAIGYFEHNANRMDYPRYRRQGLPVTSSHMESYVKELNYRIKSTEKFWNDGSSCEAMLSIRSASLCDDSRLSTHLRTRPGHPFQPNAKPAMLAIERN